MTDGEFLRLINTICFGFDCQDCKIRKFCVELDGLPYKQDANKVINHMLIYGGKKERDILRRLGIPFEDCNME